MSVINTRRTDAENIELITRLKTELAALKAQSTEPVGNQFNGYAEVARIVNGALQLDVDKVRNYTAFLADKLDKAGEHGAADRFRKMLAGTDKQVHPLKQESAEQPVAWAIIDKWGQVDGGLVDGKHPPYPPNEITGVQNWSPLFLRPPTEKSEIERLKADMAETRAKLKMSDETGDRWRQRFYEAHDELAALKAVKPLAKETQPDGTVHAISPTEQDAVAWLYEWKHTKEWRQPLVYTDHGLRNILGYGSPKPLYTTPPTAEALVEDFKRRVLEAIRPSPTLKVSKALQPMKEAGDGVREVLADIIESLPLIEGEK